MINGHPSKNNDKIRHNKMSSKYTLISSCILQTSKINKIHNTTTTCKISSLRIRPTVQSFMANTSYAYDPYNYSIWSQPYESWQKTNIPYIYTNHTLMNLWIHIIIQRQN